MRLPRQFGVLRTGDGVGDDPRRSLSRGSVLVPFRPAPGARIEEKRVRGTRNPVITAASYGSVWATAFSLRQTHGISRIITGTNAGAPTMSRMKYFNRATAIAARDEPLQLASCVGPLAATARRRPRTAARTRSPCRRRVQLAAASSANAPPDDRPSKDAVPPAWAISAARSSTSRAGEYGGVSPLSPRPRRSYCRP